jgi:GNAT superfamily N-acetyltransferase
MALILRRATTADAAETAAVPQLHTAEEHRTFVADFIARSETWIAVVDARIAGLAAIEGDWLMQLYIHPDFQAAGIGSALLARVKQERPRGFQLWTFQANAGARRFYERQGCKPVEFTDGSGNEEKTPDVRYEWKPVTAG